MNQFKNGTLLVIVATVIVSVLILMTDRDEITTTKTENEVVKIADTEKNNEEKESSEIIVEEITDVKKENLASAEIEKPADENKLEAETTVIVDTQPEEIKAPEGPFIKKTDDSAVTETENQQVSAKTEVAEQAIKPESINVVATSNQHDLLNHLIQPIWMDQKLGDFKSIGKSDIAFKIMPTSPDGLQGENPKDVVTSKSDKFAPTTVSADYNYQQMPMYNGGYFIAPMPPYLMESVLPESRIEKD